MHQAKPHALTALTIVSTAVANFVQSLITVTIGSLFAFFTVGSAYAMHNAFQQGDLLGSLGSLWLVLVALTSTVYFCYKLSPKSESY